MTSPCLNRRRPIDLAGLTCFVLHALRKAAGDRPVAIVAAELGVAHGHLACPMTSVLVLVVEQPQVDADSGHPPVDMFPIGFLEDALTHVPVGVEEPAGLVI